MRAPFHFDPERFLARFWAMDATLVRHGFHASSTWWRREIERFIRALARGRTDQARAMVRRWIIRAGRRSGKSSTLCRLAVAWAKWGAWHVPAGDIAVVAFVSVSRDEASARLRTIEQILGALGEKYDVRGEEVELRGTQPVLFKVFSASIKSVGFTAIAIFGDEVARWEARDSMRNPAAEVFGSLLPTLASQAFGFAVVCSSPWSTEDYHAQLFDQGNTAHQIVSAGTTWECNPTISEERTRELEPDPKVWSREYGNQPGGTVSSAFDSRDVSLCVGRRHTGSLTRGFVVTDASSLMNDDFAYLAGATTDTGEIVVLEAGGWSPDDCSDMAVVVSALAERAAHFETRTIFGDQREASSLRGWFAKDHHVQFITYDWSNTSKDQAAQLLRRMMREQRVSLPNHDRLRRECLSLRAHMMPSGIIRYATNGLDYVSCLFTLAHAIIARDFVLGDGMTQTEAWRYAQERLEGGRRREPGDLGLNEPPLRHHMDTRWDGTPGRGFG